MCGERLALPLLLLVSRTDPSHGYVLSRAPRAHQHAREVRFANRCSTRTTAGAQMCDHTNEADDQSLAASLGMVAMTANPATVYAKGCPSCESEWLAKSKETENSERERLAHERKAHAGAYLKEIWDYSMHMNLTQRQELALHPDLELRRFIIDSSTQPTALMEKVYNQTMVRVPYEQACYICGPEQAMLLRTLVALSRPRQCLDIGCFTGYASSAVTDAIPKEAKLTCLEVEPTWTEFAAELIGAERNVQFITAPAAQTLAAMEADGRVFDFITLDADKPMHDEYYNASLRLLRPGGLLIMFGMILFPTVEDQQAMELMHQKLPNDTRVSTAQLPVGCGIQIIVKDEGYSKDKPPLYYRSMRADGRVTGLASAPPLEGESAELEQRRYAAQSELAALERLVDSLDSPLGGAAVSGPGTEALSSMGLVALAAARRAAEEAAAEAEAAV